MSEKYSTRAIGKLKEDLAVAYLNKQGVKILDRNFSFNKSNKGGEIDIIGLDKSTIAFIEVKYRRNEAYGHPSEAVTYSKQKTICRLAMMYIKIKKLPLNGSFRFDVISILGDEITWYKNAFLYHV